MKNEFNISAKNLIMRGLIFILISILLFLFGSNAPFVAIQLYFAWLVLAEIWKIIQHFKTERSLRKPLLPMIIRLLIFFILDSYSIFATISIHLIIIIIGIYQLFEAVINIITYILYYKNNIKPRFKYLFDGIWLALLGFSSFVASPLDIEIQFFVLAIYLFSLGLTQLRDGLFFFKEQSYNELKRNVRVSLPLFIAALVPAATLNKVNAYLQGEKVNTTVNYTATKHNQQADLEVFIHTSQSNIFGAIGHVDICFEGKVISYGSYDPTSERLFSTVGDGVLFFVDRKKYIQLCKEESNKTLFGYGIKLTKQQKQEIIQHIENLKSLTHHWDPPRYYKTKKSTQNIEMYAHKLKTQADGQLYKFTSSKFKTYFVLSTNCVLLADSIIGKTGSDILNAKGFISPGTYQMYLNTEFSKPNSIVVSRTVY